MDRVTTLTTSQGNSYIIAHSAEGYWAFKECDVIGGKLDKEYNGISGCLSDSLELCIKRVRCIDRGNELKNLGFNDFDIVQILLTEGLI